MHKNAPNDSYVASRSYNTAQPMLHTYSRHTDPPSMPQLILINWIHTRVPQKDLHHGSAPIYSSVVYWCAAILRVGSDTLVRGREIGKTRGANQEGTTSPVVWVGAFKSSSGLGDKTALTAIANHTFGKCHTYFSSVSPFSHSLHHSLAGQRGGHLEELVRCVYGRSQQPGAEG